MEAEMLSLEIIGILGGLFGFLVLGMVKTALVKQPIQSPEPQHGVTQQEYPQ